MNDKADKYMEESREVRALYFLTEALDEALAGVYLRNEDLEGVINPLTSAISIVAKLTVEKYQE